MSAVETVCTVVLLTVVLVFGKCLGYPSIQPQTKELCVGCADSCTDCRFGVVTRPSCGVQECKKGPGEPCGGPDDRFGVCGDGMKCNCFQCTGCSMQSLLCFTAYRCPPYEDNESRYKKKVAFFSAAK